MTDQLSDQYKLQYSTTESELGAVYPSEVRAKQQAEFFTHNQDGAGGSGSTIAVCKLPPGRVRFLLPDSWLYVNWTTTSATLDLGWDAYTDMDGSAVAADDDGLITALGVENADIYGFEELSAAIGAGITAVAGYSKLFESRDGVVIRATSNLAIVDGDDLAGKLAYLC